MCLIIETGIVPRMKVIVLTFDRLPPSFLGCYGNERILTPHFDQLAAESVVFDQHFGENFDPAAANHAWWTGCYQFPRSEEQQRGLQHVTDTLREKGVGSTLISEQPVEGAAARFDHVVEVSGEDGLDVDEEQTPFAQLISKAAAALDGWPREDNCPRLLWLKSRGVPFVPLPPRKYVWLCLDRNHDDTGATVCETDAGASEPRLAELASSAFTLQPSAFPSEDDQFDRVISSLVTAADDETGRSSLTVDEWHVVRSVFAGYVRLLDHWVGNLVETIDAHMAGQPLLLIVTAAAGAPAGERVMMSLPDAPLGDETVHTPMLVRVSGAGDEPGGRRQSLIQTVDLVPTLLEWFDVKPGTMPCEGHSLLPLIGGSKTVLRDYVCLGTGGHAAAIRTTGMYLVSSASREGSDEISDLKLYVKLDDIWEVHDVAAQAADETNSLKQTLERFIENARSLVPPVWPKHPDEKAV